MFVEDNKSFNMALKDWPADAFDGQSNVHLTSRHDLRPTLCANKFPLDSDPDELKQAIESKNIKTQGLRRLTNAKGRETTLIIFKVDNELQANLLKKNGVMYNNLKYHINEYVKRKEPSRCVNCQQFGHHSARCRNTKVCVRCSGKNCEPKNCQSNIKKCVNCGEPHSAAYKGCTVYKTSFDRLDQSSKLQSYASIVKQNSQSTEKLLNQQITYFDLAVILTACLTRIITDIPDSMDYKTASKEIMVQIGKSINSHFRTDLNFKKIEEGISNIYDGQ